MNNKDIFSELEAKWLAEIQPNTPLRYETLLGFEDFFSHNKVFLSGFGDRERTANICSYGTVIEYSRLKGCLERIGKDKLNSDQWQQVIDYFFSFQYLSPICGLVAAEISRFAGLKNPLFPEK